MNIARILSVEIDSAELCLRLLVDISPIAKTPFKIRVGLRPLHRTSFSFMTSSCPYRIQIFTDKQVSGTRVS